MILYISGLLTHAQIEASINLRDTILADINSHYFGFKQEQEAIRHNVNFHMNKGQLYVAKINLPNTAVHVTTESIQSIDKSHIIKDGEVEKIMLHYGPLNHDNKLKELKSNLDLIEEDFIWVTTNSQPEEVPSLSLDYISGILVKLNNNRYRGVLNDDDKKLLQQIDHIILQREQKSDNSLLKDVVKIAERANITISATFFAKQYSHKVVQLIDAIIQPQLHSQIKELYELHEGLSDILSACTNLSTNFENS